MQDSALTDLDLRLIHAVQIAPRAPWTTLAPIVGADAVTLARRWNRLRDDGIVYVTGYGAGTSTALLSLIEIECAPGETLNVAQALQNDREAFTIDLTAGGRDIMVSLISTDTSGLSQWTLERIRSVARVRSMRTHLVSQPIADARNWRLRALSKAEVAAVAKADQHTAPPMPRLQPDQLAALTEHLAIDGRAGVTEIANAIGVPSRKVRDAIAALRASGRLVIRVDVARDHTPWPVYAWYFLRVPAAMVASVGPQLGRMEEVRLVVTTVGEFNVIMAVWLRTLQDVNRLEAVIEERLPGVTIADRSVVLRTVKHLGHFLDERGQATGETVPMG
ncbi:Lrp/AsnC ligand binding domain-containing protein [Leifsonia sp. NPDC080035]|uniref:Lrp/AsnC ligand binding domain-containing protein n=1 Tax=Leifsonia sp. NPDC080035 TaxID=3143936 RepID=A0AAU7GGI6_9MICO